MVWSRLREVELQTEFGKIGYVYFTLMCWNSSTSCGGKGGGGGGGSFLGEGSSIWCFKEILASASAGFGGGGGWVRVSSCW